MILCCLPAKSSKSLISDQKTRKNKIFVKCKNSCKASFMEFTLCNRQYFRKVKTLFNI